MKKLLLGTVSAIVLLLIFLYGILFTQPGNNLIRPIVESKINKTLHTKMSLAKFSLRPSFIFVKLKTPMDSIFVLEGSFGVFSKSIDVKYMLGVNRNESKFNFNGINFKGPFYAKGTIKGFLKKDLSVDGRSNFASSKITYNVRLKNMHLTSVVADISDLRLEKLLSALNKPAFAKALIRADIKLTSFKKNSLKGSAVIYVKNGNINRVIMRKRFKVNVPKTNFNAFSKIILNGSLVDFTAAVDSNLSKSSIKGSLNQQTADIKADYNINIKELALLKPITNMDLRGRFSTNGKAAGNSNKLFINGKSDVADSKTTYNIKLNHYKPVNIIITAKKAHLDKLLALLNKPIYAYGLINTDIKMTNLASKHLNGSLRINAANGVVNSQVVKKLYQIEMPRTAFKADIVSNINNYEVVSKININSSVASLYTKTTTFNFDKFILNSDYKLNVPNLDKLHFITNRHLRGGSVITGTVSYNKTLKAAAHSNMWHGVIDAKLINNNITGTAKNIKIVKLMDMLMYKRIFDSKGNIDFSYNLSTKQGVVKADFADGHILPNRMTFLLHNMARFDITREVYKTTKIYSKIKDKRIISNLDMTSRLTRITSNNALTDLNKNSIDAKVKVEIKKQPIYVKLKGNLDHPKIKLDLEGLFKRKIKRKIKNKIKGFLKGLK